MRWWPCPGSPSLRRSASPKLAELGVRIGKCAAIRTMAAAFHSVEITISPPLLRALSGQDLEALRQEVRHYVAAALPDSA